jgi:hypothetical protein
MSKVRWRPLPDEKLLDLPFRDLNLAVGRSDCRLALRQLHRELRSRGLRFQPHAWFATEWFSPDGVPGIAIPFYLADERLKRLERRHMGEVEGGSTEWMMRILRHEAAHAFDTAYLLRHRPDWRRVFGPASRRYPSTYTPRPGSRRFVLHLGHWYAQSHPTEDFAETFAVWLQPRARWRREYAGWPALRKLEFVDELMRSIASQRPKRRSRREVEPASRSRQTLREHYRRKMARYAFTDGRYDAWLLRTFARNHGRSRRMRASQFLREYRPQLERLLTRRARLHPYVVQHAIDTATQRARELDLRLKQDTRSSKRAALRLLERMVLDILKRNRENYAL